MSNKKKKKTRSGYLKKSSQGGDKPEIQPRKLVPKPGKFGKEIDDIFTGVYQRTPEVQVPESREVRAEIAKKKRKRNELNVGVNNTTEIRPRMRRPKMRTLNNNNLESQPRKRTPEGFRVFKEEEIGFNRTDAGGTRLCPFDCNCCF